MKKWTVIDRKTPQMIALLPGKSKRLIKVDTTDFRKSKFNFF